MPADIERVSTMPRGGPAAWELHRLPIARSIMEQVGGGTCFLIAMVGLPVSDKSYISSRLVRYLCWLGIPVQAFNASLYRRQRVGSQSAAFFDPANPTGSDVLQQVYAEALSDALLFLRQGRGGGQDDENALGTTTAGLRVAILDAANQTLEKRKQVMDAVSREKGAVRILWIESQLEHEVLSANVDEASVTSPDYAAPETRTENKADYWQRIRHFKHGYSRLEQSELRQRDGMITLVGGVARAGQRASFNVAQIEGWFPSKLLQFLVNIRKNVAPIYLSRHGQSEFNVAKRLGGDPPLSELGVKYADKLAQYMFAENQNRQSSSSSSSRSGGTEYQIWCSGLRRTQQTAGATCKALETAPQRWPQLNEIETGLYDGYTYEEIEKESPENFLLRKKDKLRYRYPRGESYLDVITRLEGVIFELERAKSPVLVVAHQAVLRCVYGYFASVRLVDLPAMDMPLHTVIKLSPSAYSLREERHCLLEIPAKL